MHALQLGRDPFFEGRFVSSDELLDLGISLMADAEVETPRPHALVQFRDGLLIAFLAVLPLRLEGTQASSPSATHWCNQQRDGPSPSTTMRRRLTVR